MAVTFDGPNKLMILSLGTTAVDVAADLYTPWMDWLAGDSENSKYLPAFNVSGGNPTVGGEYEGTTFFVLNGWKIRPQEASHYLKMTGNIVGDADADIIESTLGAYTVTVSFRFSSLVQGIATGGSGLSAAQNTQLMSLPDLASIQGWAVDDSITFEQAQKITLAALAGKRIITGNDIAFRDQGDTKDVIDHATDGAGSTVTITVDGS